MGLSVTQRIKTVTQPKSGYVPVAKLKIHEYEDFRQAKKAMSAYKTIAGVACDYLTRMFFSTKVNAFKTVLIGSYLVSQYETAKRMLDSIIGLDQESIVTACKLTIYDTVFRMGASHLASANDIQPDDETAYNIGLMVKRSVDFFKNNKLIQAGIDFVMQPALIDKGDADYLSEDTLWDMKASQNPPTIEHTLQLLVYYIMYSHSFPDYMRIKNLGIWNPYLNRSYTIEINSIPAAVMYEVSQKVIGYRMCSSDVQRWHEISGADGAVISQFVKEHMTDTGFRPSNFGDGIYDISVDDYWSYYRTIAEDHWNKPKFRYTKSVKFLKNGPYSMFVSISESGVTNLLYGGSYYSLKLPLEWYYAHLKDYGDKVLEHLTPYWRFMYGYARGLKAIPPDKQIVQDIEYPKYLKQREERLANFKAKTTSQTALKPIDFNSYFRAFRNTLRLQGTVHGCIIDLDYSNHVFVNPIDGTITAYRAVNTLSQRIYKDLGELLAENFPAIFPEYQKLRLKRAVPTLTDNIISAEAIQEEQEQPQKINGNQSPAGEVSYETAQYRISRMIRALQYVYDNNLVCRWLPTIIPVREIEEPVN